MATYEDIKKANASIKTTDIKGKPYAEVNERIIAFRKNYPEGFIDTEILSNEDGVCIMRAEVGFYDENGNRRVLGTGHAYEREGSSFINSNSYIENCETSVWGRALGAAGYGIDSSVASYEEVSNAILNQNDAFSAIKPTMNVPATEKQVNAILKRFNRAEIENILTDYAVPNVQALTKSQASEILSNR